MAPRLPLSKLEMIQHMILSKPLTASQMAKAAGCSKRSIINISNNLGRFGNVRAPPTRVGRRRTVTPPMIEALCDRLLEKPGLYVDEMAIFYGTSSASRSQIRVSNGILPRWDGRRKLLDREQRNRMRIYGISTYITCQTFSRTIWPMWMSRDVINELDSDGQAGLR